MRTTALLLTLIIGTALVLAQSPTDLVGKKFCFDQGHGGYGSNDRHLVPDPGVDFYESVSNYYKGIWVRQLLQARGATVLLTRPKLDSTYNNTDPEEPSLSQRWAYANANNVQWFHSIHSNAFNASVNYSMVLVKENISTRKPVTMESVEMAALVYQQIRAKDRTSPSGGNIAGYPGVYMDYTFYGGPNGGYNLGVLSGLTMPGELSEGSFHDYLPETRRLMNNDYRKNEAYGIYNAFVEYFGVPFDTLGIICGTQTNGGTPLNNISVRLLPVNRVYTGDTYKNGFFFFDSLPPGNYKVVFETPGYANDTVAVTLSATAKSIQGSSPAADAINVPRDAVITVDFLAAADTAKVRAAFSITPAVDGVISWNVGRTTMTFTPSDPLGFKTNYTVKLNGMGNSPQPTIFVDNTTVTSNVASTSFFFSFTTVALPPYVTQTQPLQNDTNFSVTSSVGVRFSSVMDTASLRSAVTIVPTTPLSFTFSQGNTVVLIKPLSGPFEYSTHYTVTVDSTAASSLGIRLDGNRDTIPGDPFVLSFRTQANPLSVGDDGSFTLDYSLQQNFPNPFNPSTTIAFSVREAGLVTLKVYDVLGREVATLVGQEMDRGRYAVQFDAAGLSSSLYFYRLTAGDYSAVRRMMVLK